MLNLPAKTLYYSVPKPGATKTVINNFFLPDGVYFKLGFDCKLEHPRYRFIGQKISKLISVLNFIVNYLNICILLYDYYAPSNTNFKNLICVS